MIKQSKIDNMLADYRQSGNQAATARKYEVSINTLKKYIKEYQTDITEEPGNKKDTDITAIEILPATPDIYNNININNNNIYKDNKDNNIKDINNNIDLHSTSVINNKSFNSKYISKIENILDLAIKRYKKEYKNVHPNYISKDIGIFTDKLLRLHGENTDKKDIKQIIFNNFGTNKDMLDMITQIQLSKNKITS